MLDSNGIAGYAMKAASWSDGCMRWPQHSIRKRWPHGSGIHFPYVVISRAGFNGQIPGNPALEMKVDHLSYW